MSEDGQASVSFRMGVESDAPAIAHFYNMANNGLSEIWWGKQAREGETWTDAFVRDIKTPGSIAYYPSVVIAEVEDKAVGILIAFPQEPVPPKEFLKALPSSELCLLELRRLVEGSMYIAIVAVDENYRGFGIARHFVNMSLNVAEATGIKETFGIIHESNKGWLESFFRRGFKEKARADVGDHPTFPKGSKWVLFTRPVKEQQESKA